MFSFKNAAEDIRILDWQVIKYASPAIDLLYNIFPSTDKSLRDKEYDNILQTYYKSLSKTVKLLGSDPEKLFTYENLQSELKRYGKFLLMLAPIMIQMFLAESSEIKNLDELSDNAVKGGKIESLVDGISEKSQLEYDRRLNNILIDVIELGYVSKID